MHGCDVVELSFTPRILTVERGWTDDAYDAWLARTLRDQLLRNIETD